jgi:hypothetical protein
MIVTAGGLLLFGVAHLTSVPTYAVILLLGAGPLMAGLPQRGGGGAGRRVFAGAVALAVLCTLWAAGLYALARGKEDARTHARTLPDRTAVVVYSKERLALSGPGIKAEPLGGENRYAFRYTGLRLLIEREGRYYLLPVGWRRDLHATYVLKEDEELRVELYAGHRDPAAPPSP